MEVRENMKKNETRQRLLALISDCLSLEDMALRARLSEIASGLREMERELGKIAEELEG